MKCLALDSSGLGAAVALGEDGRLVARRDHDLRSGYAESLFGLFDEVLSDAGWAREDLSAVAAVEGPGSFTGLRVGIMTAKTLAHAQGWSLWLAHAHDLLATAAPAEVTACFTLQSAGRAHAYARRSERESVDAPWCAGDLQRLDASELATLLQGADAICLAEATFAESLARPLPPAVAVVENSLVEILARLASAGRAPAREVTPQEASPLYAGPSQAERAAGLDLSAEIARPKAPVSWDG